MIFLYLVLLAAVPARAQTPRAGLRAASVQLGGAPALWVPAPAAGFALPALTASPIAAPSLAPSPAPAVVPANAAPAPRALLAAMAAAPAAETPAASGGAYDGAAAPAPVDDASGALMEAAIASVRGNPVGTVHELAFRPSPGSLKRMAALEGFEVLVARRRGAGWMLIKGDVGSVTSVKGDFDAYIHNHYYHPVLAKSFTPYPSDGDLVFSAGKDARFIVVSDRGVVEWSPRVPYYPYARGRLSPERKERMLDTEVDDSGDWRRRLRRGNLKRAALNLILPAFYGSLLAASGIAFKLYRWSDRALTPDFLNR